MNIVRNAVAGTLESNDVLVTVTPGGGTVEVDIDSIVAEQFGGRIEQTVLEQTREMGIVSARIRLEDKGALDCTIRARVETALKRAAEV